MMLVNTSNLGDAKCASGNMHFHIGSAKSCLLSLTLSLTNKAGVYQSVLLVSTQMSRAKQPWTQSHRTANC